MKAINRYEVKKQTPASKRNKNAQKRSKLSLLLSFAMLVLIILPALSITYNTPYVRAESTDEEQEPAEIISDSYDIIYAETEESFEQEDTGDICDNVTDFITTGSADSFESLAEAICRAPNNGDELIIEIANSFDLSSDIIIPVDSNVTLVSNGSHTLTTQGNYRHFSVNGKLTLSDGIILTSHDSFQNGGGVKIRRKGVFIMYGGTIRGNNETLGGGVYIYAGTFIMKGGEISGNTGMNYGGGVYNDGTFIMEGGEIKNNIAFNGGGGVLSKDVFTMEGGKINSNRADWGGGIHNNGLTKINGGEISENSAIDGGGVCVDWDGTLTIQGGTIIDNTAALGGGVCIDWGTLEMKDGKISSNNAGLGGGVYIDRWGKATIERGIISNNEAVGFLEPEAICNCCKDEVCSFDNDEYVCVTCREEASRCNCTFGSGGGVFTKKYESLFIGENAVFRGNTAVTAYGRDPALNSIYKTNVNATTWTSPFTQGFNNYDINVLGPSLYNVTFADWNDTVLKSELVPSGNNATPPTNPSRNGYEFTGWFGDYSKVTENRTITAQYSPVSPLLPPEKTEPPLEEILMPETTEPPLEELPLPTTPHPEIQPSPETPVPDSNPVVTTPIVTTPPPATEAATPVLTPPPVNIAEEEPVIMVTQMLTDSGGDSDEGEAVYRSVTQQENTFTVNREAQISTELTEQTSESTDSALCISIGGKDVLLFAPIGTASWALANLVIAAIGVILALLISIHMIAHKRGENKKAYDFNNLLRDENNADSYKLTSLSTAIIFCNAGVFLFIITQDMKNIMSLTNSWTPLHLIIFAVTLVNLIIVEKRLKIRN